VGQRGLDFEALAADIATEASTALEVSEQIALLDRRIQDFYAEADPSGIVLSAPGVGDILDLPRVVDRGPVPDLAGPHIDPSAAVDRIAFEDRGKLVEVDRQRSSHRYCSTECRVKLFGEIIVSVPAACAERVDAVGTDLDCMLDVADDRSQHALAYELQRVVAHPAGSHAGDDRHAVAAVNGATKRSSPVAFGHQPIFLAAWTAGCRAQPGTTAPSPPTPGRCWYTARITSRNGTPATTTSSSSR
jgi:hypothetical protein